jgi:cation transport regulator ChaC
VSLTWQPPTDYTDGTPLVIAGYHIHYGTQSQTYTSTVDVTNPGLTTYVVDNLPAGTYYFAVTAYDASGQESGDSPELSTTVN